MNVVIILAGGGSKRMKNLGNKCLLPLNDKPVICYSLDIFSKNKNIDQIIIVAKKDHIKLYKDLINQNKYRKVVKIAEGGETRKDSMFNGFNSLKTLKKGDIVVFHNSANPFLTSDEVTAVIKRTKEVGAVGVAHKIKDTIKEIDNKKNVIKTLNSSSLVSMQTPQAIEYYLLKEAISKAKKENFLGSDYLSFVENIGAKVEIISASSNNFKITDPYDYELAKKITESCDCQYRIGVGADSHQFSQKQKGLVLGGALFKNLSKFEANSDGDVILHALFNAISSALSGKSLGETADKMCLIDGISDSKQFIEKLLKNAKELKIVNISISLECEYPKIDPISDKIKGSLSKIFKIDKENIGITAGTSNGVSKLNGIKCVAGVILRITN